MKQRPLAPTLAIGLFISALSAPSFSQTATSSESLQQAWATINYQMPENERRDAMHDLVEQCDAMAGQTMPQDTRIWCGIVRSSYAGLASPFSAMKYAKAARRDFEQAIDVDGTALSGSAYTSLGTLYFKVPGWPVGFGDDDKARELLLKGLSINPEGIDPNFFYAEFLYEQGDYATAHDYLVKAQQAPARPGRSVADEGRQQEIQSLLASVNAKLKH